MKARLAPVFYQTAEHLDFVRQVSTLKSLLANEADHPRAGCPGLTLAFLLASTSDYKGRL